MTSLIIGYGNTLRSDDGAGYRIAEKIAEWGLENVRSLPCHQLTPELADDISKADTVFFVDAGLPNSLTQDDITLTPICPDHPESTINLGHGLNPYALLAMAKSLYNASPDAYLVTVPTEDFNFGEQMSALTQESVAIILDALLKRIRNDTATGYNFNY